MVNIGQIGSLSVGKVNICSILVNEVDVLWLESKLLDLYAYLTKALLTYLLTYMASSRDATASKK